MKELVLFILQVRNQIQLFHWQTDSYAEHKAFDQYLDDVLDLTDELVESLSGKKEKVKLNEESEIIVVDYDSVDVNEYLDGIVDFYKNYQSNLTDDEDSEIKNIIDEIVGQTDKLKYLLTLK